MSRKTAPTVSETYFSVHSVSVLSSDRQEALSFGDWLRNGILKFDGGLKYLGHAVRAFWLKDYHRLRDKSS